MKAYRLVLVWLFLAAAAARGQEATTVLVPAVGNVFGSNARWATDVELANTTSFEVDVAIELASIPGAPPIFFTLGPGQVQRFPDIVRAFGMEFALSPLRVTTSRRHGIVVRASAYALGTATPAPRQVIPAYASDTYYPVRILEGLSFSNLYRTNIGLVNAGEQVAEFVLALQRVPGRNVTVTHVFINPGDIGHIAIQALFPMITDGHGFAVVVETPTRDTHVYASVIESETHFAKFVAPRVGAR